MRSLDGSLDQAATKAPPIGAPDVVDPREGDPSFRKLPDEVKREVRAGWRDDAARDARIAERQREARRRSLIEAAALIVGTEFFLRGPQPLQLACAAALAWCVGELWHRTSAGQLATPLIAAVPHLALQLFFWSAGLGDGLDVLFGSSFIAFATAYLGVRREQRIAE